jgi:hypothetical protein
MIKGTKIPKGLGKQHGGMDVQQRQRERLLRSSSTGSLSTTRSRTSRRPVREVSPAQLNDAAADPLTHAAASQERKTTITCCCQLILISFSIISLLCVPLLLALINSKQAMYDLKKTQSPLPVRTIQGKILATAVTSPFYLADKVTEFIASNAAREVLLPLQISAKKLAKHHIDKYSKSRDESLKNIKKAEELVSDHNLAKDEKIELKGLITKLDKQML